MSVGVVGRSIAAPAADAARVAGIRNNLNLNDKGAVAGFGEPARKALQAGGERLATEVRAAELKGAADRLRAARERIERLDPTELEPRGGLDNIFNGRVARLHRFRRAFEAAGQALGEVSADLDARTRKLTERGEALNRLHEGARALILDIDAYLEAGRARLAEAQSTRISEAAPAPAEGAPQAVPDPGPGEGLRARLKVLERWRSSALQQLPLIRVVQNADAFLLEDFARARAAIAEWRAAWGELLGIGRGDKIRPHVPALAEAKLAAGQALEQVSRSLAEGAARRAEAEARIDQANAAARA